LRTLYVHVATFQQLHIEYMHKLIRYSRACGFHHNFHERGLLLSKEATEWRMVMMKQRVGNSNGRHLVLAWPLRN